MSTLDGGPARGRALGDGSKWRAGGRLDALAVGGVILVALLIRVPTLMQPLLEAHAFRQTQTAYTALVFHESGVDLFHPQVPVLGPPFELAFDFPLFQALATIPMAIGLAPDAALRLTCLATALVAGLLLWWLMRRLAGRIEACAALVFFLFSPFAMLWSRTAMLEYLVMASALGFLAAAIRWCDTRRPAWWVAAALAGMVAMAVKSTAGFFWVLPVAAYALTVRGRRSDPWLWALLALPLGVGLAWTEYADTLRAAGPGTAWMTTARLTSFLFGPLEERVSPGAWRALLVFVLGAIGPAVVLLLAVVPRAVRASARPVFWTALLVAPLASILVFFNLYTVHDYYLLAATPVFAMGLGLAVGHLVRDRAVAFIGRAAVTGAAAVLTSIMLDRPPPLVLAVLLLVGVALLAWLARPRARPELVVAGALGLLLAADIVSTVGYWGVAYRPPGSEVLAQAAELDRQTGPADEVVVVGLDWSPSLLYYARRRGQMLPPPLLEPGFVASLPRDRYRTFFSGDPNVDPLWPATHWAWVGAIDAHTYALGASREALRDAPLAATDDSAAFVAATAAGTVLLDTPAVLRCGEATTLRAGARGTWLRLAPAPRDARLRVWGVPAPIPARQFVATTVSGGSLRVGCAGADTVTVLEVVDAP